MALIVDGPYFDSATFEFKKSPLNCADVHDKVCIEVNTSQFISATCPLFSVFQRGKRVIK